MAESWFAQALQSKYFDLFPIVLMLNFLKKVLILFSKTWLGLQLHNTKQFRVSIASAPQLGFLCKTLAKASQKLLIPAAHVNLSCSLFSSFICSTETVLYSGLLKLFSSLSSRIHQPFPSLLSSTWDLAKELRGRWSSLLYWFSLEWSTKSFYSLCTSLALQFTRENLPHGNVSAPLCLSCHSVLSQSADIFLLFFPLWGSNQQSVK